MVLFVSGNVERLAARELPVIGRWLDTVDSYLNDLGDAEKCDEVVRCLRDAAWHYAWPEEKTAKLRAALQALKLGSAADSHLDAVPAIAEIKAEDLSLTIPEDISRELLDGLLQELPQQTERLSQAIQKARHAREGAKAIQEAQRVAHTIKGAANTVGVKGLANLTHRLEDILIILRDRALRPSQSLYESMVEAADCLEEMSEALLGLGEVPKQAPAIFKSIVQWVHRFAEQGTAALQSDDGAANEHGDQASEPRDDVDSPSEADGPGSTEIAEAILRVPAGMIDELLRIVGESLILGSQLQERVQRTAAANRALIQRGDYLQNLVSELDQLVQIRSIDLQHEQLSIEAGFDPLELDRYNELHTITHRLVEAASDALEMGKGMARQLGELDDLLIGQERLSHDTQHIGMRSRMLPIKTIMPRLQRSVRQTCRTTGKQVELHVVGEDVLLDSDVLSALVDPLMHLLRNAVDHGIETTEQRNSAGKAQQGRIELQCVREGNQVVVRCSDDGAGLDIEEIRETAGRRELMSGGAEISDETLQRLIFEPGFTTRRTTSQISGRGVGLDVVYTAVQSVKGSMHLENQPGHGCTFELRVPVSLMSVHGLIVQVRGQTVAIATHGIEQILHPESGQFSPAEEGEVFDFDDKRLSSKPLEQLLGFGADRRKQSRTTRPVLLVRQDDRQCAVTVEQIQETRNIVVKELGRYLPSVKGVIGATIFGDGSVVPVLDLPELLRNPVADLEHSKRMMRTDFIEDLPLALIVDDSISARRSLEQVMTDIGMRVRTAKDGLEALESIEQQRPHLLVVDLEMPRMNGLELAAHVRATVELTDLPIIMITSRSTAKHRQLAEAAGVDVYLTKPYSDDALFDHVDALLRRGSEAAERRYESPTSF
jgi:chemotaxis protein histidine kinase CheA/ActR/RegA family two-component response regulator